MFNDLIFVGCIVAVNTHMHADHITGTGELKKLVPSVKSVISEASGARADMKLKDGDTLEFGKFKLDCRLTPGHTSGELLLLLLVVISINYRQYFISI